MPGSSFLAGRTSISSGWALTPVNQSRENLVPEDEDTEAEPSPRPPTHHFDEGLNTPSAVGYAVVPSLDNLETPLGLLSSRMHHSL